MQQPVIRFGQGTGADTYFRLGFCPMYVKVIGGTLEDTWEWFLPMLADDYGIKTLNTDGVRTYVAGGVQLCTFNDGPGTLPGSGGAPTLLEQAEWYKANGIKIDANATPIGDGSEYIVIAFPIDVVVVKAIHDGGDNVTSYFQDSSVDFKEAGISGGQQFILINETGDNYAYVKSVEKPTGQTKHCRLNLSDAAGNDLTAADIDDAEVAIIIPKDHVQYPLSGIGIMT